MPYSLPETKEWIKENILIIAPKTVLDVGAGEGVYADLINEGGLKTAHITAVEIWKPYIETYELEKKYDTVIEADVRGLTEFSYDLVIFGDVLEHMSKEDAVSLWNKVSAQAKYAIIAIPTVRMPQGAHEGNPYEAHVKDDWRPQEVLSAFSNIIDYKVFTYTGAFLAKF